MPARRRSRERTPSAATSSRAVDPRRRASCTVTALASDRRSRRTAPVRRSSRRPPRRRREAHRPSSRSSPYGRRAGRPPTLPPKVRKTGRTASPVRLSVITISVIGWALGRDLVPHAEPNQHAPSRRGDRRCAGVTRRSLRRRGVDERHLERGQRPPQRQGKRQTDMAAAGDHDVGFCVTLIRILAPSSSSVRLTRLGRTGRTEHSRGQGGTSMPSAIETLLSILDLEPLEHNLFRGRSPQVGWQRVFGGQVIGQALVAAQRTVEAAASCIRCMAISCGPATRRFPSSTRSTASATAAASPHAASSPSSTARRSSPCRHRSRWPSPASTTRCRCPTACRSRKTLLSEKELIKRFIDKAPEQVRRYWERERPIEMRPVIADALSHAREAPARVRNLDPGDRTGCRTTAPSRPRCSPISPT